MSLPQNTYKNKQAPIAPKTKLTAPRFNWRGFAMDRRTHVAAGVLLILFSFYLLTALVSHIFTGRADQSLIHPDPDLGVRDAGRQAENWMGLSGAWFSDVLMFQGFGLASLLIPPLVFTLGYRIVFRFPIMGAGKPFARVVSFIMVWASILLGLVVLVFEAEQRLSWLAGGVGYEISAILYEMTGWAAWLIVVFGAVAFVIYYFNITSIGAFTKQVRNELESIQNISQVETEMAHKMAVASFDKETGPNVYEQNPEEIELDRNSAETLTAHGDSKKVITADGMIFELHTGSRDNGTRKPAKGAELEMEIFVPVPEPELVMQVETTAIAVAPNAQPATAWEVTPPVQERVSTRMENFDPTLELSTYRYPVLELLRDVGASNIEVDTMELTENKNTIIHTLKQYGIDISSIKATVGPTVTLYEIVPAPGVRISKITNLENDIALSLAALGIRIVAPIPGKGTIGIEVPNKKREMVAIRTVLSTEKFMKSEMALPVVLGKTISNEVFITDLAKMPHLLMAGATGQGKSVGLNVLLTSLIYKKHPSQLKFVLVDPKKVELSVFAAIERHFLAKLPNAEEAIITDTRKVVYTLNSLCIEMDQRYDLLKEAGTRNIKEYNEKFTERRLNPEKGHRYLPYIVLVIDELADLMMTAGKEVETPIARLAQLARAIGIHLVVATQRPSVNVITGIIKANFPARLSFRVTSKVDSRTILDTSGAEQLIGNGDMLLSIGSDMVRLQCAYIDTDEVERLCEFVGAQRGYPTAYMLPEFVGDDEEGGMDDFDPINRDAMFDDAARTVVMHQQGSTSLLQRKLKLGYARAGRIMDQLEAAGIVSAFNGQKIREVKFMDVDSLEQYLKGLDGGKMLY